MKTMTAEEVKKVIEGKGQGLRVPLCYDFWIGNNVFDNDSAKRAKWLEQYPCDIETKFFNTPGMTEGPAEDPGYFWAPPGKKKISPEDWTHSA